MPFCGVAALMLLISCFLSIDFLPSCGIAALLLLISCFASIDVLPSCDISALLLLISCLSSIDFLPSGGIAALLLLIACFSSIVFLSFCLLAVLLHCCCWFHVFRRLADYLPATTLWRVDILWLLLHYRIIRGHMKLNGICFMCSSRRKLSCILFTHFIMMSKCTCLLMLLYYYVDCISSTFMLG